MEPGPSFLWDWTWVSKNWDHGFYWQLHVTCYVEPACTAVCVACHGSQDSASLYCTKFSRYLILSRLWNSCIQFLNSMQPLGRPQASWEAWESKLFIFANESRYKQLIFNARGKVGRNFSGLWALGDLIVTGRTERCRKSSFSQEGVHEEHFGILNTFSWS